MLLEDLKTQEYDSLTIEQKIIVTTSSKLIKHFKGMEGAGILGKEETAKFIGSVKKLAAIACGITKPAVEAPASQ